MLLWRANRLDSPDNRSVEKTEEKTLHEEAEEPGRPGIFFFRDCRADFTVEWDSDSTSRRLGGVIMKSA